MKYIVMVLTNWPDPETVEYSGTAFHDRGDALREVTEARTDPHVKYAWVREVEEEPRLVREWNIIKDTLNGINSNSAIDHRTTKEQGG